MKRFKMMNAKIKPIVAACALALAAGQAGAVDYYLVAKPYTKQLPMADGTLVDVPMWGYVLDTGDASNAHCYDITGAGSFAARTTCVESLGSPSSVNPEISIPAGDDQLRIFLTNNLPVHTSITIPGQELPWSGNVNGPTWNNGDVGPRCAVAGSCSAAELSKKVRSYTLEANPTAGRRAYVWNNFRGTPISGSGTMMYHSGTHPQLQVYMGLFGAVTKDAVAGEIYPGVPYDNQVSLIYSEVDPVHNAAVAALDSTYTTDYTPIEFHPTWFLINGEPYQTGDAPIPIGVPGDKTLLRFISAAGEKHVPVLQGLTGTIHAEDGIQYTWQDGATGVETVAPKQQYSIGLAPLKTKDVIVEADAEGLYAVYDGNGFMTNPSDPNNIANGDTVGGMLRFLEVGATPNSPPVAAADSATVETNSVIVIDVLANDTDVDGDLLTITGVGTGTLGTASTDGSTLTYAAAGTAGADTITYDISDGNGGSATGSVSITVIAGNTAPVATDDTAVTDEDTPLSVAAPGVLTNDSDVDGDPMTAVLVTGPTQGTLVLNADGSFDYTPNADANGTDSFTYTANDVTGASNIATVSITINPVNDAPVITSTPVLTADEGQAYSYDVDATDVDVGDSLTYSLDAASLTAGLTIDSVTGVIDWASPAAGIQPVTVTVTDSALATATQTFDIDVAAVVLESPPIAAADAYAVNEDALLDVAVPGVLSNDTATNGDAMSASLVSGPSCAWTAGPNGTGAFVLNGDGSFHYEPIPNWNSSLPANNPFCNGFAGNDSFTYMAIDNDGNSNVVTVDITVNEMNDAPVANNDTVYMTAMGSITIPMSSLLANDSDVDLIPFDPAQISGVRDTDNGQIRGTIDGWNTGALLNDGESFTYNFANGRIGVITTFDYHVTDGLANSATATVEIRRELAVITAECEHDVENNICSWSIQGRISAALPNNTTTIEAVLDRTGEVIGTHVETGGAAWNISPANGIIPQPGDTISVRAIHATDPDAANAFIDNFPVTIL